MPVIKTIQIATTPKVVSSYNHFVVSLDGGYGGYDQSYGAGYGAPAPRGGRGKGNFY